MAPWGRHAALHAGAGRGAAIPSHGAIHHWAASMSAGPARDSPLALALHGHAAAAQREEQTVTDPAPALLRVYVRPLSV
jgi:hypothetical protein